MNWKKVLLKFLRVLLVVIPCSMAILTALLLAPENQVVYRTDGTILVQGAGERSGQEGESASDFTVAAQSNLLKSRSFMEKVALEAQILLLEQARTDGAVQGFSEILGSSDPVGFVQRMVDVSAGDEDGPKAASGLLTVRFSSDSPLLMKTVADVTFDRFFEESRMHRATKQKQSNDFIEDNLKFYEDEYRKKQEALKQYKVEHLLDDFHLSNAGLEALEQLSVENEIDLLTAKAELNDAKRRLDVLELNAHDLNMSGASVQGLRDELKNLEIQRSLDLRFKTEAHPLVALLDKDIQATREQLKDAYRKNLVASVKQDPYIQYKDQFERVIDLESRFAGLETRKAALTSVREEFLKELPELEAEEMELARHQMETDLARRSYEEFLNKRIALNQTPVEGQGQIKPLKMPEDVVAFRSYRKYQFLVLATVVGLGIGFALSTWAKRFDTSVKSLRELKNSLNLFPLGAVPYSRKLLRSSWTRLLNLFEENSQFSDSLKNIRTNILLRVSGSNAKKFLVTGSVPGEGKTTFVAALAASFAQSGDSVLIVDSDLRRPSIHSLFEQKISQGFGELLADGSLDWKDLIHSTSIANLDVLHAGTSPQSPPELLGSDNLDVLLERFARVYDFILFDTPALLAASDCAMLVPKTDGAIFVIKEGGCDQETAAEAADFLKGIGAGILGAVLTFSTKMKTQYAYRYQ